MQLMTRSMHELPWILVLSLTLGGTEIAYSWQFLYMPNSQGRKCQKSPKMRIHKQMIWHSKCLKSHPDLLHFPTYDSERCGPGLNYPLRHAFYSQTCVHFESFLPRDIYGLFNLVFQ